MVGGGGGQVCVTFVFVKFRDFAEPNARSFLTLKLGKFTNFNAFFLAVTINFR